MEAFDSDFDDSYQSMSEVSSSAPSSAPSRLPSKLLRHNRNIIDLEQQQSLVPNSRRSEAFASASSPASVMRSISSNTRQASSASLKLIPSLFSGITYHQPRSHFAHRRHYKSSRVMFSSRENCVRNPDIREALFNDVPSSKTTAVSNPKNQLFHERFMRHLPIFEPEN